MNLSDKAINSGRKRRRVLAAMVVAGVAGLVSACGRESVDSSDVIIERRPNVTYEQLFPYYVELCVTSQYRSKVKGRGGPAGHALLYLKGACKDEDAPFPQLRLCHRAATNLDDPEHGVGVSVNRWLRNVNWLAIPRYTLFYDGNLASGERLTQAHYEATVRDAIAKGVFDGVEFHDYPTEATERSVEDFATYQSIGSDFALRFARTSFCSRLPVTKPILVEIMAFLNDKNREYARGEAEYNWSGLSDNCVHTVHNALAAANIWPPKTVQAIRIERFLNLAVPANQFVNLAVLTTEGPIGDYKRVHEDDALRDAFHEFFWLPTRHGALLKILPIHPQNDLFDTSFRLFALQSPFRRGMRKKAIRLLTDKRFVELDANLRYFRERYDKILKQRYRGFDGIASVRGTPYRRVQRLHYQYIQAQKAEVDALLARLPELSKALSEQSAN